MRTRVLPRILNLSSFISFELVVVCIEVEVVMFLEYLPITFFFLYTANASTILRFRPTRTDPEENKNKNNAQDRTFIVSAPVHSLVLIIVKTHENRVEHILAMLQMT